MTKERGIKEGEMKERGEGIGGGGVRVASKEAAGRGKDEKERGWNEGKEREESERRRDKLGKGVRRDKKKLTTFMQYTLHAMIFVYLFIYFLLFISLFIYLFLCLFIYLFIHSFVDLFAFVCY